jgi:hypothetical protein
MAVSSNHMGCRAPSVQLHVDTGYSLRRYPHSEAVFVADPRFDKDAHTSNHAAGAIP